MMGSKPWHFAPLIHLSEDYRLVPAFASVAALAFDIIKMRGAVRKEECSRREKDTTWAGMLL